MLMVLGILLEVEVQKNAKKYTFAVEEISPEQFYNEFITALQAQNTERIQQLITDNHDVAEEMQRRLMQAGEGAGKNAKQYRILYCKRLKT